MLLNLLDSVKGVLSRANSTSASQGATFMLHPNQFQVNEAWIAFQLNDAPIHTRSDGDFNCIALMDAASCFMMSWAHSCSWG